MAGGTKRTVGTTWLIRTGFLLGVSAIALAGTTSASAQAVGALRAATGGAATGSAAGTPGRPATPSALSAAQTIARSRSAQNLLNAQARVNLAEQAQAAARAAARAAASSIPNGLQDGGLVQVKDPKLASEDTTGYHVWQGASNPSQQVVDGRTEVTVTQNQSRALLTWESLNIGANTTLVFSQKENGVAKTDWVALNRVVGKFNPTTGLPTGTPSASQILGSIKSDGQVIIVNQGGVMFGGSSTVNTHSLLVSSLEVGRNLRDGIVLTQRQRNDEFLSFGLLGIGDQLKASGTQAPVFSRKLNANGTNEVAREGSISFAEGATVTAGNGGYVIALGPDVTNNGVLSAEAGQVSLAGGRDFYFTRSEGDADSRDPFVRGLLIQTLAAGNASDTGYVVNGKNALITANQGFVSLGANGAVLQQGILRSTTSVSRNGAIDINARDIRLDPGSLISILPDVGAETIPQSADSIAGFKKSRITIGVSDSTSASATAIAPGQSVELASGSVILAPSANVAIGARSGSDGNAVGDGTVRSRVFVASGATIDVGGVKDLLIAASRSTITIDPVKGNELRDTPLYREGFLNGATITVDPRLSGVRADGVRWIGSPLLEAASYYAQVGVTAAELMTAGGNVTLGADSFAGANPALSPDVIVKAGAVVDVTGGWVRYEGGAVRTSRLIARNGQVVDISRADPNGDYVAVAGSYSASLPRFGATVLYGNLLQSGGSIVPEFSEGRDAGSLTVKASAIAFDGTLLGQAFAGQRQLETSVVGRGISSVYGDGRHLQSSPSDLPSAGYLNVQALSSGPNATINGGADIRIGAAVTPLDAALGFGESFSFSESGALVRPTRDAASLLPPERRDTILLSDSLLNGAGLAQVNLQTSGSITLDGDVTLNLAPGGAFTALAGRTITLDGDISAPGGVIGLQTVVASQGSVFADDTAGAGSYDIRVGGKLSVRGRWSNDFGNTGLLNGTAFLDGGTISMAVASRVATPIAGNTTTRQDISGSILIGEGATIDVAGGGYVNAQGALDTTARGGNLYLISQDNYFQFGPASAEGLREGLAPGIRTVTNSAAETLNRNPAEMSARIVLDGTILAHGFGGGGTFSLTTPAIQFGEGTLDVGAMLSLDFFSKTGFANYEITSFGTQLIENRFSRVVGGTRRTAGGYNAVLATQTLTVRDGDVLNLTQSRFAPVPTADQQAALTALGNGGDLYSVLAPVVPATGFDRQGIALKLGGLVELHVEQGGSILGDARASITASKIWNEGRIRLVGGSVNQSETLFSAYAGGNSAKRFEDFFTVQSDGTILEDSLNALGIRAPGSTRVLTNAELANSGFLYLEGALGRTEGIRLGASSVTDLSGASLRNPYLPLVGIDGRQVNGTLLNGGTLSTAYRNVAATGLSIAPLSGGIYGDTANIGVLLNNGSTVARSIATEAGAQIDIAGASDTYTYLTPRNALESTPVWSNGGAITLGGGGSLAGSLIDASGGAPAAQGGTLTFLDPVLVQSYGLAPIAGQLAADQIAASGFDTFVARGNLASLGDVKLSLDRGFFLESRPYDGITVSPAAYVTTISATGALTIAAPYVAIDSYAQAMDTPLAGVTGSGSVVFQAGTLDIRGAVRFDRSISDVSLLASGDLRLIGARPLSQRLGTANPEANSLLGQLVVNGDLTLRAGQVYPTTGSTFLVASAAADGAIRFEQAAGARPATPYSAGSNLLVQAATIEQTGTVRAPLGQLTLGSTTALVGGTGPFVPGGTGVTFAPATQSVTVASGSVTSVSAGGLSIPYGTTTDQIEWYFSPTRSDPLTAPPTGILKVAGTAVTLAGGATIDLSGGGDVYAYEFVPGTGGSRDLLDRFNNDPFSSNDGLQFADGRQVYAIVPGLSNKSIAALDPIYSADYGALYDAQQAGRTVYLSGVPGLAAGMYTLLPAKYAMLPGGMRVVEVTDATPVIGSSARLADGTVTTTGYYGVAGTGLRDGTPRVFSVQSQETFRKYSNIVTSSANAVFKARALRNGLNVPRLPIDAGRIVLEPLADLTLDAALTSAAATGGRGALADISGQAFRIVSSMDDVTATPGTIVLTADGLTKLNAQSLFIGGIRTDNADGTTSLDVRARTIAIENDASNPLSAPELLLATSGTGSLLQVADGAAIVATGTVGSTDTGNYTIAGESTGAFLRVSGGADRLVVREKTGTAAALPQISIGQASLTGKSIAIGSTGGLAIDTQAALQGQSLAFDASRISFAQDAGSLTGLVITADLRNTFAAADRLILRSASTVGFSDGDYAFKDLTLDTGGLLGLDGGNVNVTAKAVTLANSGAAPTLTNGAAGTFGIAADTIAFTGGSTRTYGFGGGVTLGATKGITYSGIGGLDVGGAAFTLNTPFIAEAAIPIALDGKPILPSLTLASTGAVTITGTPGATLADGTPGAKLTIEGGTVDVTGATLRATAGQLAVKAADDITIAGGARLIAPSYARQFGDKLDPYLVSAPGGVLTLASSGGNVDLGTGTTLSVGGAQGKAGTLVLRAAQGEIKFGGTIDGKAPDGGASLTIDTGGRYDLAGIAAVGASGFTNAIDIRTGTGDLTLAAGRTLKVGSLLLAAEGGRVDIAGTIDTSGTEGGDVSLFGREGVTLRGTAVIDASAKGYAETDSRLARGGDVLLGTDGTGDIDVQTGARILLDAKRPGSRLIPVLRNGELFYSYVGSDIGGTLTLRAPIVSGGVDVDFAGGVSGASNVILEAFKRWDLGAIAADPAFTGVVRTGDLITLDTGQASAGKINFLADLAPGTIPDFVQSFDVSSSYARLGSLPTTTGFVARPGVELAFDGDITLKSNWNLAAAIVDEAGALAAGVMRQSTKLTGKLIVNPGREAELLEDHSNFLYRVGGSVRGASGALSLRAGGDLTIAGSINDGMFVFGDQTDPDYLAKYLGGGGGATRQVVVPYSCLGVCSSVRPFAALFPAQAAFITFNSIAAINISGGGGTVAREPIPDDIPFSAAANSAAALGNGTDGAGDPLGSASLFPILSGGAIADSWSYSLVGGAARTQDGALLSIDPMRTAINATGGVSIEGTRSYTYGEAGGLTYLDDLALRLGAGVPISFDNFVGGPANIPGAGATRLTLTATNATVRNFLMNRAAAYFGGQPASAYRVFAGTATAPQQINTSAQLAENFLLSIEADLTALLLDPANGYATGAGSGGGGGGVTAFVRSLVRTGTGSVDIAAAGNVDLTNGAVATRNVDGSAYQVGGTAVYTVGHRAVLTETQARDVTTGQVRTINPAAYLAAGYTSAEANSFQYGKTVAAQIGILLNNPVYADGGGDIVVDAGGSVSGRRDAFGEARIGSSTLSFLGTYDQPWLIGTIGQVSNLRINPQLFQSGIGTLAGGDLTVRAGGDLDDLTLVSLASVTTADVAAQGSRQATRSLMTFGGGNLTLSAGGDLVGGSIDLARGVGVATIGGSVAAGMPLARVAGNEPTDSRLRIRLSDSSLAIGAGGSVDIQGVGALGAARPGQLSEVRYNRYGFYSPYSGIDITANASITSTDEGATLIYRRGGNGLATAVYPSTVRFASIVGDLGLTGMIEKSSETAKTINLFPSAIGQLGLFAGGSIAPVTITMEDRDPGLLPGYFSTYTVDPSSQLTAGQDFNFPAVLPSTDDAARAALHNPAITHAGDKEPVRIGAGGDIVDMILSVPKQARIQAGRDVLNMMFFGQNLEASDITRVTAGRDIVASSELARQGSGTNRTGDPLPTLQGNSFVIAGPGTFSLEAGRDAGPFLNSATISDGGLQSYAGGILSIGNDWNPYLPANGASIDVLFGVAKGADYASFRDFYLDPANLAAAPDYLFEQTEDTFGNKIADRSKPIYEPLLIQWMQVNALDVLGEQFGTKDVDYQQAFEAFSSLDILRQRAFLVRNVYFNELEQTSRSDGPSYLQYSRGYGAVNRLFPASFGYTQNSLDGGAAGASQTIETGNLDLRLSTIQTSRSGGITLLGPGGRILAGSTVRTAEQAARRNYEGPRLYSGAQVRDFEVTYPIDAIPTGFEGIITLRGGTIQSFTDGSLLLNQSRLFTQNGGDITLWSSNGDLNAGQGPKTAANFPPVVVRVDANGYSQVDVVGGVAGAGIAAFQPEPGIAAPDVFLIAPRGTVDAGDAGVRVAGNLFVAAAAVANADNFKVGGSVVGVTASSVVDAGAVAASNAASAAATKAAQGASGDRAVQRTEIFVNVQGYSGPADRCTINPNADGCPK